jgi:hypothetical protein
LIDFEHVFDWGVGGIMGDGRNYSEASGSRPPRPHDLARLPGAALAAVVDAHCRGDWVGGQPQESSTAPLAEVLRGVAAARRVQSWAYWAVLTQVAALIAAWEAAPPISNDLDDDSRAPADPALTSRLQRAVTRLEREIRAETSGHSDELAPVFASAEIALGCGLTTFKADQVVEMAEALFLEGRLPRVRRLAEYGWADPDKVHVFVRETRHLDVAVANAVERIVIGDLPGEQLECPAALDVLADPAHPGQSLPAFVRLTCPQLRAAIIAAITALDAEATARRAQRAREGRHVTCRANADGTGMITAELALEAAAAVWNALTAAAKTAKAGGDPRTLDQLRADALLARATGATRLPPEREQREEPVAPSAAADAGTEDPPADTPASDAPPGDALASDVPANDAAAGAAAAVGAPPSDSSGTETAPARGAGQASGRPDSCANCGASFQIPTPSSVVPFTVSLTMPMSVFLGLSDHPAQLDGYGPIAAGLARQMAADAARHTPGTTTWRCVVTHDEHGTVLGVGRPIRTPLHDPPPRLAELIRTAEPFCCFPGCRIQARRRCELDHRVPYEKGGPTCSCNVQPLCKRHHRLKGTGLVTVRTVSPEHDSTVPLGTVEWTSRSGLTYRHAPPPATPPAAPHDPDAAAAVEHARRRDTYWEETQADPINPGRDVLDELWQRAYVQACATQAREDALAQEIERRSEETRRYFEGP